MPGENPTAKGVSNLMRAYRIGRKMRDKAILEKSMKKGGLKILVQSAKKKMMAQKGYDDDMSELPSAMKFVSNNHAPLTPVPRHLVVQDKMNKGDDVD